MNKKYAELLKRAEWRDKRREIMTTSDCCQKCGTDDNLHMHHTYYSPGREPWEYKNECFRVLCKTCHETEHSEWTEFLHNDLPKIVKSRFRTTEIGIVKKLLEMFCEHETGLIDTYIKFGELKNYRESEGFIIKCMQSQISYLRFELDQAEQRLVDYSEEEEDE